MIVEQLLFEDVEIGDDIGPVERIVTSEQVNEFVNIWGDVRGPSRFTDAEVARREGLPGPIVPGAMNIAMLSRLLTDWSPTVRFRNLDVVFRGMVPHDSPLKVQGIVTDTNVVDGEARLDCDVFIENEEGTRLVIGKATVALPVSDGNGA